MPPTRKGKGKKKSPSTRLAEAVQKRSVNRPLSTPITSFRIPVVTAALPYEQWATYQVKYGMPVIKLHRYVGDEEHDACQVPVYIGGEPTVYLPLPLRYRDSWILLCYRIVYWAKLRDLWESEVQKDDLSHRKRGIAQNLKDNCAVRLLSHIMARRLVAEELLKLEWRMQWGEESVYTLDEYLIRDKRDLLFTKFEDVDLKDAKYLKSDPCDPRNDRLFRTDYIAGYAGDDYMTPPQGDDSWIAGDIKGLDDIFKLRIRPQTYQLFMEDRHEERCYVETPYNANARVPACWSEVHEPALRFLTEERYVMMFMENDGPADPADALTQNAKKLSASGGRSSEHITFDSPEVMNLLRELHFGDGELKATFDQVLNLMGEEYCDIVNKLVDDIVTDPGGDSRVSFEMAVETAKEAYLAAQAGNATASQSEMGNRSNAAAGPSGTSDMEQAMDSELVHSSRAHSLYRQQDAPSAFPSTEEAYEEKITQALSDCPDLDVLRQRLLETFRKTLHQAINDWVGKQCGMEDAVAGQADLAIDLRHEDCVAAAVYDFGGY